MYHSISALIDENQTYFIGVSFGTISDKRIKQVKIRNKAKNENKYDDAQIIETKYGEIWYFEARNRGFVENEIIGIDEKNDVIQKVN
ncbi:hypothetical protein SAMN02745207_02383 [Clostridium grantii DSM 8605]|uniref:Uncharacterized protein n=1 Tax=Clostridium grantii DSM 8605 TaxID=1121316 RepID=A0A1M5VN74_9CLOT|nr:hypothetical protein SAMN02745207_02383 [Clostridium grantii DSM 8605]